MTTQSTILLEPEAPERDTDKLEAINGDEETCVVCHRETSGKHCCICTKPLCDEHACDTHQKDTYICGTCLTKFFAPRGHEGED